MHDQSRFQEDICGAGLHGHEGASLQDAAVNGHDTEVTKVIAFPR